MQYVNRRMFVAGAAAVSVMPAQAFALNEKQAGALVNSLVGDINKVIDSGKSEAAMIKEFEKIFKRYADLPYVAAYAMGVDARRATAAQKKAFTTVFTGYISRKYGRRFREFIGGRLEMSKVRKVKNYYEVTTIAHLRGEAPFDVSFHVSDRSGKDLFFNMFIEGVNMLLTERSEIGSMLDKRRGDIDAMISDLKKAG
ncbi:MlaC/ttg2D family ABC transporter substrate-binding protein [Pelagimonas varians]|uniref:Putative phospholipid-binding protein MlaC n=1 Tax=Pelagimonas varians TaxID=696760 RepID=A0A238KM93_9RHOB|nr:ABC transporter substrate-binding protein [Pelagimonas varians]PYG29096.1 phospholipid transport system substrate-binding protein [Pelagimonas varians]SMX43800.1 putative phospholipid-binding protein MlaC precursor [Pelagimonas varians]